MSLYEEKLAELKAAFEQAKAEAEQAWVDLTKTQHGSAAEREAGRKRVDAVRAEEQAFKRILEYRYKTSGNPKADRLWEIAWSEGHSSGYGEVEIWYEELSELILP